MQQLGDVQLALQIADSQAVFAIKKAVEQRERRSASYLLPLTLSSKTAV